MSRRSLDKDLVDKRAVLIRMLSCFVLMFMVLSHYFSMYYYYCISNISRYL